MKPKLTNLDELQVQIDDVLALLDNRVADKTNTLRKNTNSIKDIQDFTNTESLLERCQAVVEKEQSASKPIMRVIHHFSCSGGTLVSKCIASMPNVFLLSEVHPYTNFHLENSKPRFSPADIVALARYADVPMPRDLAKKLFLGSVKTTSEHVESLGGVLVLREHTHSDYLLGTKEFSQSAVIDALEDYYTINSILTIRHPLDAYAAMMKNNWVQFEPATFDEYCRRFLSLIERFDDDKIFKFEDLIGHPKQQMIEICAVLDIPFSDSFEDIFDMFKVTGNSGRSSDTIDRRDRIAPQELIEQCQKSKNFAKICDAGWYQMPIAEDGQVEEEFSKT